MVEPFVDHVALDVSDLERSRAFCEAVLRPLGYGALWAQDGTVAFGREDAGRRRVLERLAPPHGAPGEPPHDAPGSYAAYLLDPDDNAVEAVVRER